jgi:subtilisin family serine protease
MKTAPLFLIILALALFSACQRLEPETIATGSVQHRAPVKPVSFTSSPISGQYIVMLKESAVAGSGLRAAKSFSERTALMESVAGNFLEARKIKRNALQRVFSGQKYRGMVIRLDDPAALQQIRSDENVELVEQDQLVAFTSDIAACIRIRPPLTPTTDSAGRPNGQGSSYGLTRVGGSVTITDSTKRAWIIDTGIDMDHPDLNVDVANSMNFTTSASADDQYGHGTHVAGIIAAINNGYGSLGIASGAKVVSVKVLDDQGEGTFSSAIAGLAYVETKADANDVINLSLGGASSMALDIAVVSCKIMTGAFIVVAAGNQNASVNAYSPARLSLPGVIVVGAVDENDMFTSYSNYGYQVQYVAPGEAIYSTFKDGGYVGLDGTSMAAPHVAGILLATGTLNWSGMAINTPDYNAYRVVHL